MGRIVAWIAIAGGCAACGFTPATVESSGADASVPVADGPDTPVPDATPAIDAGFSVARCPGSYTIAIASKPMSRYRVDLTPRVLTLHRDACNSDALGITHLVVLDDETEAAELQNASGTTNYYVGAIQARDQPTTSAMWFAVTGGELAPSTWQINQPNDNADVENNEQNAAAADSSSGLLNDIPTNATYYAICECDGLAVDPTIDALITAQ
jgi:hypothetical protein